MHLRKQYRFQDKAFPVCTNTPEKWQRGQQKYHLTGMTW